MPTIYYPNPGAGETRVSGLNYSIPVTGVVFKTSIPLLDNYVQIGFLQSFETDHFKNLNDGPNMTSITLDQFLAIRSGKPLVSTPDVVEPEPVTPFKYKLSELSSMKAAAVKEIAEAEGVPDFHRQTKDASIAELVQLKLVDVDN